MSEQTQTSSSNSDFSSDERDQMSNQDNPDLRHNQILPPTIQSLPACRFANTQYPSNTMLPNGYSSFMPNECVPNTKTKGTNHVYVTHCPQNSSNVTSYASTASSMTNGGVGPLRKPKRIRTAFTTEQVAKLERQFQSSRYITSTTRAALAKLLNVTERIIKVWFQNRRMKDKINEENDCQAHEISVPIPPREMFEAVLEPNELIYTDGPSVGHYTPQSPPTLPLGELPEVNICPLENSEQLNSDITIRVQNALTDDDYGWIFNVCKTNTIN